MYADMKPKTLDRIEHQLRLHEGYLRSNFLVPNVKMRWDSVYIAFCRLTVYALLFLCCSFSCIAITLSRILPASLMIGCYI